MKILTYKKIHKKLVMIFALPMFLIFTSGLALLSKKIFPAIQPNIIKSEIVPQIQIIDFNQFKNNPKIEQVIFRPSSNNVAIRYTDDTETQMNAQTGEILSHYMRHSNWIIRLHQGTFYSEWIKNFIFIPTGIAILALWITGVIIYIKLRKSK